MQNVQHQANNTDWSSLLKYSELGRESIEQLQ